MSFELLSTLTRDEWRALPYRPGGVHELARDVPVLQEIASVHPTISAARVTGADTIRDALDLLPPGLGTYSSYVDNYQGFYQLIARKDRLNPHAVYFSYTIFGNPANCADIEPGAMHPGDLPNFIDNLAIPLPGALAPAIVYYSASIADQVISAAHGRSFIRCSAHYGSPHICEPGVCGYPYAHGTQWTDTGPNGENYDRELWRPGVLSNTPQPTPPEDTVSIAAATNKDGTLETFVHLATGEVKHTWQVDPGGHWIGVDPNKPDPKQVAWTSLGTPGKP